VEVKKCQTGNQIMNLEDQQKAIDKLNASIINLDKYYKTIPFQFLKNYVLKKILKARAVRDEAWRNLRDETRKKYPERYSTDNYKPPNFREVKE